VGAGVAVIYDACVLFPAPLRDLLMHLALTDLFRARWSHLIHDEWTRSLLRQRPDLKLDDLARTRSLMDAHVRDCLVTEFEHLIPSIEVPDANDRHVVAAAVHCGASLIVTFNMRHFPDVSLNRFDLTAQHPDDFIVDLLRLHTDSVLEAVVNHRCSLRSPPKSLEEYLDTLTRQGLGQTVGLLRGMKGAI